MNFTTDVPKGNPEATYIVASAVKCEKFFPNSKNEGPSFRMHAVILNNEGVLSGKYQVKHYSKSKKLVNQEKAVINEQVENKENFAIKKQLKFEKKETQKVKNEYEESQENHYILCHIRKIDKNYKKGSIAERTFESEECESPIMNLQHNFEQAKVQSKEKLQVNEIKREYQDNLYQKPSLVRKIMQQKQKKQQQNQKLQKTFEEQKQQQQQSEEIFFPTPRKKNLPQPKSSYKKFLHSKSPLGSNEFNLFDEPNNEILESYSTNNSNEQELNYSKIFNLLASDDKKQKKFLRN